MNPMNQYPVKYSVAPEQEYETEIKGKKKYSRMFFIISIVYLILIFFFTLIIYSSLYGHPELYHKHHNGLHSAISGTFHQAETYSTGKCPLKHKEKIEEIYKYRRDEHQADFVFCYIILGLCIFSFFIWTLVFLSKGKKSGLNSKGAISFVVFLFFLIIVATIIYFIFFMAQGEDHIDGLKRINGNFITLLNQKCYDIDGKLQVSIDYMHGYINSIIDVIRPFVIVNFIVSCIYLLIWLGLNGAAAGKQSLCHPL